MFVFKRKRKGAQVASTNCDIGSTSPKQISSCVLWLPNVGYFRPCAPNAPLEN